MTLNFWIVIGLLIALAALARYSESRIDALEEQIRMQSDTNARLRQQLHKHIYKTQPAARLTLSRFSRN